MSAAGSPLIHSTGGAPARPARRPRLLLFMNDAAYVFNHRLPLLRGAVQAGYEVHAACPGLHAHRERVEALGVVPHDVAIERGVSSPAAFWRGILGFDQVVARVRPDLVHCITLKQVIAGGPVAARRGVPLRVHSIHGLGSAFTAHSLLHRGLRLVLQPLLRAILGAPGVHTIVHNEDDRTFLVEGRYCGRDRLTCTPGSGVDTSRFYPNEEIVAEPVRVVLGARMIAEKGVVEFVEAARQLRHAGVGAKFMLAGPVDPKNLSTLSEGQLRSWQAEGVIEWLGEVSDMAALLRQSHVACLPSYREGLPKFLTEAAACGLPTVTTDVAGCRSAIEPEVTGLLVPARQSRPLADALRRLIEDAPLRARLGAAGRELALRRFAEARVVEQVLDVYRTGVAWR
jgi:glycosyltransferase involved in cell wall biosynthesis